MVLLITGIGKEERREGGEERNSQLLMSHGPGSRLSISKCIIVVGSHNMSFKVLTYMF